MKILGCSVRYDFKSKSFVTCCDLGPGVDGICVFTNIKDVIAHFWKHIVKPYKEK